MLLALRFLSSYSYSYLRTGQQLLAVGAQAASVAVQVPPSRSRMELKMPVPRRIEPLPPLRMSSMRPHVVTTRGRRELVRASA